MSIHIIALKMLRAFWEKHPEAEQVLKDWHSVLEKSTAKDLNELKKTVNSADYVPPHTVFDVGGNNYRVIGVVQYKFRKVHVREVMTDREYDHWNKRYRKGKV
jgi:mRNA interferase HigB